MVSAIHETRGRLAAPSTPQRLRGHQIPGARSGRAGGVLLLTVVITMAIAAFAAAALQMSSMFTHRRVRDEHDARAFYLAEAGLSEAYLGLASGNSGQIGSMEQPAVAGDGLLWVDATEISDTEVRLECTALAGLGRATLALTVARVEEPIGLFAEEDLRVDEVLLVDGYDSQVAPYLDQTTVDKTRLKAVAIEEFRLYFPDAIVGQTVLWGSNTYRLEHVDSVKAYLSDLGAADSDLAVLAGSGEVLVAPESGDGSTSTTTAWALDAPTTGGGGKIGSNGDIQLTGTAGAIYGDAVPGPAGQVYASSGYAVTGHTIPRGELLELDPVEVPPLEMQAGVVHEDALPLVIPPSEAGYESLRVLPDSELVVRGPATLVVGSLVLEADADLTFDNVDGRVLLYVLQELDLAFGARVHVLSEDPADLGFMLVPEVAPANLFATSSFHGVVYGPGATIAIEAPFEVFGALVGGTLDIGPNVRFHFDGGIAGDSGPFTLPRLISWEIAQIPAEVARLRIDPFQMMGLDAETLPSVDEAQQSTSWTLQVTYLTTTGERVEYDGPLEAFDYSAADRFLSGSLIEPDVQTDQPWRIYVRYVDFRGMVKVYDGPVEDFPYLEIRQVLERVVTPPPS